MIFDLLTAPQGAGPKKCAVSRPIHVSRVTNAQTKFGWISSHGLGGDSITDRQMEAITISPFTITMEGSIGDTYSCSYFCEGLRVGHFKPVT